MIYLREQGNLGEKLFQYAFAVKLSTSWNYHLDCTGISGFQLPAGNGTRTRHYSPTVTWTGDWPANVAEHRTISPQEILAGPTGRLDLKGLFRRFDLIEDQRHSLLSLMLSHEREIDNSIAIFYKTLISPTGNPENPIEFVTSPSAKLISQFEHHFRNESFTYYRIGSCYPGCDPGGATVTQLNSDHAVFAAVRRHRMALFPEDLTAIWSAWLSCGEAFYVAAVPKHYAVLGGPCQTGIYSRLGYASIIPNDNRFYDLRTINGNYSMH